MDNYDKDEIKGREKFEALAHLNNWKSVTFNPNKYGSYDVSFITNDNKKVIAEIKNRLYSSDAFNDWFFEKEKYDKLMTIQNKTKTKKNIDIEVIYVNFYTDDKVKIWLITPKLIINTPMKKILLNENDYSDKKVLKDCYFLHNTTTTILH